MGLITWIKDKYYNHKFKKAQQLFLNGMHDEAINVFKEILDVHPDAPENLLAVYHSNIKSGQSLHIQNAAELYTAYPILKDKIIQFCKEFDQTEFDQTVIEYQQALYGIGIKEMLPRFIKTATAFVLSNQSVINLKNLTQNAELLSKLSENLFSEIKQQRGNPSKLKESERICRLILPYINSDEFNVYYSHVRFDVVAKKGINEETIKELDNLFKDVNSKLNLNASEIKALTDKAFAFAKKLYSEQKYAESLLVSQRLMGKYPDAKNIYSESALKLYSLNSSSVKLIKDDILYKAIEDNSESLISGLEPFIPYSVHKEKYVSLVCEKLKSNDRYDKVISEALLSRSWSLTNDIRIISSVLSVSNKQIREAVALFMLSKSEMFLSQKEALTTFVDTLQNFPNTEFTISVFEQLLDKGKKISTNFEKQILKWSEESTDKQERINRIDRGLPRLKNKELYSAKGSSLIDYIGQNNYDSAFAISSAKSIIGKHKLAEVILARVYVDEASKSETLDEKQRFYEKALSYKESHDKMFDENEYNKILPEIESGLNELAQRIYSKDEAKSVSILYMLRDKSLKWFDTYASLKLKNICKAAPSVEVTHAILNMIEEGKSTNSNILDELWAKFIDFEFYIIDKQQLDEAIEVLRNLKTTLISKCNRTAKTQLCRKVDNRLIEKLTIRGKAKEKNSNFKTAIKDYEETLTISPNLKEPKYRILICRLKDNHSFNREEIQTVDKLLQNNESSSTQRDLAYRWCIYLIGNGKLDRVQEINAQILNNDSQITAICQEEQIKKKHIALNNLNDNINRLNKSTLSSKEAMTMGKNLSKYLEEINMVAPVSPQKARLLKDSIRIYAIEKFYEEGDFIQCIQGLKVQDSEYLSDPVALRNIAIMCLRAAEEGQITDSNYKELISIWATAIYQQLIFVQSLDYTSWDDPYSFTLDNALGKLDNNDEELPENVNYDDETANGVVSIREVQKALISRMDAALNEHSVYQQFYSSQLDAMDKLAEQELDEDCVLVAPYLLNLSKVYKQSVSNALTKEINEHYGNWETILEIGVLYGLNQSAFSKYANAKKALDTAIKSIENKSRISTCFAITHIDLIKEYDGLKSELISAVTTCLNKEIANDTSYLNINRDFGVPVKNIGDDRLAFIFSNYINQNVVAALNENSISLAKGTPVLFEIYSFCKCNPHLKRNLENITEALVHNYLTEGDNANLDVLDRVLSSTREFDQWFIKALKGENEEQEGMLNLIFIANENRFNALKTKLSSKSASIQRVFSAVSAKIAEMKLQLELSSIVQAVNNDSMKKCDALEKVYNIYKNNKNNHRVCENLAALVPMCVMEYIIQDKYGKQKVMTVLNSLKTNMSTTFRSNNSEIGNAYNMIWNQLPYSAQQALQGISILSTLTSEGLALKKGLDYLKALR